MSFYTPDKDGIILNSSLQNKDALFVAQYNSHLWVLLISGRILIGVIKTLE
jgi:hypothetical protein